MSQPAPIDEESRFCPDCGYNLHGIASDRCPECGLDLRGIAHTTIPWENRRQIGRVKAFWRTLLLATFRSKRLLAGAAAGPVDSIAAIRFRWIVVVIASLTAVSAFEIVMWQYGGVGALNLVDPKAKLDAEWEVSVLWSAGATFTPVLPIGAVVTLIGSL